MLEMSLIGVLLVGLLGGGHCVGMCGGIVSAVSMSVPSKSMSKPAVQWRILMAYNFGRVSSYSLAGALAGWLGASSFFLSHVLPVEKILYGLASVMLVLLGLYLSGLSGAVRYLEDVGQHVWRKIQPISKRFLPVQHAYQAYFMGMVWGWLPCGLVYSVLIAAMASGGVAQGALVMFCFGIGTLPALLMMGVAAIRFKEYVQHRRVRLISGLLVLAFGVYGLSRLWIG